MSDYEHKRAIRYKLPERIVEKYKDEFGDFDDYKFEKDFNLKEKGFELNYGYDYDKDTTEKYLDIVLYSTYGEDSGDYCFARCLTKKEIHIYLEKFKEIISNITSAELRHVDYCYYNGVDCPSCYEIEGLNPDEYEDYEEKYNILIEKIKNKIEGLRFDRKLFMECEKHEDANLCVDKIRVLQELLEVK